MAWRRGQLSPPTEFRSEACSSITSRAASSGVSIILLCRANDTDFVHPLRFLLHCFIVFSSKNLFELCCFYRGATISTVIALLVPVASCSFTLLVCMLLRLACDMFRFACAGGDVIELRKSRAAMLDVYSSSEQRVSLNTEVLHFLCKYCVFRSLASKRMLTTLHCCDI